MTVGNNNNSTSKPETPVKIMHLETELLEAARSGELDRVAKIIASSGDHIVDINNRGQDGCTALRIACNSNADNSVAKLLIRTGCDVNIADTMSGCSPLYVAAQSNNIELVQLLLAAKAEVNSRTADNATALYIAALKGYHEIVELLLLHGADVQLADNNGATPLHVISELGDLSLGIAKLLIEKGADINAVNQSGWTPAHDAAQANAVDIVSELVEAGADVSIADMDGWTPLYIAAQNGFTRMAQLLIGANSHPSVINRCDIEGNSPLIMAAKFGHADVADLLVEAGADIFLRNKNGESAFDVTPLEAVEVKQMLRYYKLAAAASRNMQRSAGYDSLSLSMVSSVHNSLQSTPFGSPHRPNKLQHGTSSNMTAPKIEHNGNGTFNSPVVSDNIENDKNVANRISGDVGFAAKLPARAANIATPLSIVADTCRSSSPARLKSSHRKSLNTERQSPASSPSHESNWPKGLSVEVGDSVGSEILQRIIKFDDQRVKDKLELHNKIATLEKQVHRLQHIVKELREQSGSNDCGSKAASKFSLWNLAGAAAFISLAAVMGTIAIGEDLSCFPQLSWKKQ